jgi:hypothetical protein
MGWKTVEKFISGGMDHQQLFQDPEPESLARRLAEDRRCWLINGDGYLQITDRAKDLIKSGENGYPAWRWLT